MILAGFPKATSCSGFGSFKAHTPWTPNLVLTCFVQYDTESQNIGTHTRFRGRSSQATTCSLSGSRGWQRQILSPHDVSIVPDSDIVAVKLRWTFRR